MDCDPDLRRRALKVICDLVGATDDDTEHRRHRAHMALATGEPILLACVVSIMCASITRSGASVIEPPEDPELDDSQMMAARLCVAYGSRDNERFTALIDGLQLDGTQDDVVADTLDALVNLTIVTAAGSLIRA